MSLQWWWQQAEQLMHIIVSFSTIAFCIGIVNIWQWVTDNHGYVIIYDLLILHWVIVPSWYENQ